QPDSARADPGRLQGRRTSTAAASPGERVDRALRLRLRLCNAGKEIFNGGSHGLWLLDAGGMPSVRNRDQARSGDGLMDALRLRWHGSHIFVADDNKGG